MNLRDALSSAVKGIAWHAYFRLGDPSDKDTDAADCADAILADPAFRAALTEAVAEACRAEWPSHREGTATYTVGFGQTTYGPEWTVLDPALPSSLDYAAIVARMLGESDG